MLKGAEKLLALIIGLFEALAYVKSGSYGDLEAIGYGNGMLIVLQLVGSVVIVILLDDMLNNGYGLGSGTSLFIATNICESIIWKSFSPITVRTSGRTEFEGCIVAAIHKLFTSKDTFSALSHVMFRKSAPNLN